MTESKNINPFPGLRPFETDEHRLFFGREGQSDALIARLQRSHFLAVVGTSGSGKSSLVRAGLLPALSGGLMADAGSGWRIAIMRPGSDPLGNLALALANKQVLLEAGGGLPPAEARAVIEATLRRGSLGLVEAAKQARLSEREKLLVVVDQFEELFRFRSARALSSTADEASAFVKLMLEASQQRDLSIYIVPTMRSDFLGDCAQFQGLPEAINEGQYLIPRMTRDERRFAITGPVGVTRGKITEPLVNRLMNDVGDNPDQLPILQHALMRTWDYWTTHRSNGEPIGIEHYLAIGTMSDALSEHADEAFNALTESRKLIAKVLFKALTERGADNRELRRPTSLKDICEIAGASEREVIAVIDVFRDPGNSFLMPPAGVELKSETIIDISHESLIRNWRRLQDWVKDEADSARIYRRLADAAMDCRAGARGLLDDVTLQYVLKWRDKVNPDRVWGLRYHQEFDAAMGYLEESRLARDERLATERERERRVLETAHAFADKQARSARRLRWASVAMALLLILAFAGAVVAVNMKQRAEAIQAQVAELLEKEKDITKKLIREQSDKEDALKDARAKADIANEEAGKAQKEKERANEQTRIAALSEVAAKKSLVEATKNRLLTEDALKRSSLIRRGLVSLEASRRDNRDNYAKALNYFECLSSKLQNLMPDEPRLPTASKLPCKQSDKDEPLTFDLAWVYTKLGSTYSSLGTLDAYFQDASAEKAHDSRALDAYKRAVDVLARLHKDDHLDMLNANRHLAHAYQNVALTGYEPLDREKEAKAETPAAYFKKAEERFGLVLGILERNIDQVPDAAAVENVNLARLYRDMKDDDKAINHFKIATLLWKKQVELLNGPHEEDATNQGVKVQKELASFYLSLDKLSEAEETYDRIIDIQENYELRRGREIADSYSELGQIYQAQAQALYEQEKKEKEREKRDKAKAAFRVANLLRQATLKYRRGETDLLCEDLLKLAPEYAKLGRHVQVRQAYDIALYYRSRCMVENAGDAAKLLNEALVFNAASTTPTNLEEENAIYATLITLKGLQEEELDPIYDHRLREMNKRSGALMEQYARTRDVPRFTAAYLSAAGEIADFYKAREKNNQAEAAYHHAFNALVIVKQSSDPAMLSEYETILSAYQSLLIELKKSEDAATVGIAIESIKAKLKGLPTEQ